MLPTIQLALRTALQHHQAGQFAQAEQAYQKIIAVDPENAQALQLLGVIRLQTGRPADAAGFISRAIRIDGGHVDWYVNLGAAHSALQRSDEALAALRAAIALAPASGVAHSNLAAVLKDIDLDEAIAEGRRAVELQSDPVAHSNLLLSLNYRLTDPAQILAEHREWARRYAEPLRSTHRPHSNDRNPDCRLCVGYISADFREHAMAHFLRPLLASHDRQDFEIVCFDDTRKPDAVTAQFKQRPARWIPISGRSHEQAAEIVRGEKIDILIDVTGHFAGNRLLVFARRPAPVQVSCIGYPCTTGLQEIDYRLSDNMCDPPGAEAHSSETLVRLPEIFWCYEPPAEAPEVIDLPANNTGAITFGSANVFAKITREMLDLWGQILSRVPNSRLALQGTAFTVERPQQTILAALATHGVAPDRIEFIGREPPVKHFETLSRFDIALDTFPFNGGTTTCHSLWMGAPVVTLAGNCHASCMGASILTSIGLPELIAATPKQYAERAVALASDLGGLSQMRLSMRQRMRESSLMDAPKFTRAMEVELRKMWRRWCARR